MADAPLTHEYLKATNAADFPSPIMSVRSDPSRRRATAHGDAPPNHTLPAPPFPPAPSCHRVSITEESSGDVGRVTINRADLTFEMSSRRKSQMVEQSEPKLLSFDRKGVKDDSLRGR